VSVLDCKWKSKKKRNQVTVEKRTKVERTLNDNKIIRGYDKQKEIRENGGKELSINTRVDHRRIQGGKK